MESYTLSYHISLPQINLTTDFGFNQHLINCNNLVDLEKKTFFPLTLHNT